MRTFKRIDQESYKVGVDEIEGLKTTLQDILKPIYTFLKDKAYWTELEFEDAEYKSRDGFAAYSDNCGGPELEITVPKCEEYSFPFLEFGEHDGECCNTESGECIDEGEGYLDAKFRVWLKYEGQNADGEHEFYLYAGGGNGYLKGRDEATLFEESFTAKTPKELKKKGDKAVKNLLTKLGIKSRTKLKGR